MLGGSLAPPGRGAGRVEVGGDLLAVDRRERVVAPALDPGERLRQVVAGEEARPRAVSSGMAAQLAAEHPAVEHAASTAGTG